MNFKNFTISKRLSIAFGLVLALNLATAVLSLYDLELIEDNMQVIVDNNSKVALNQDMSEAVHVVSRVIRTLVILDDETTKKAEAVKITAARAAYDKAWEQLQTFPPNEAGRLARQKIVEARDIARPLNNRVIELAMANEDVQARELLLKESGPATQKWQEALDANIALQQKAMLDKFESSEAAYTSARNTLIMVNVGSMLLALLLGWLVTRSITQQLGGEPAQAIGLARAVSDGNLAYRNISNASNLDRDSVMGQLLVMQENLTRVVGSVRQGSESLASASAQIAQGNSDLSARTESQASALEQTAASMEQLNATVKQNASSAMDANQLAAGAVAVAERGGAVVGEVVHTMRGINDSSRKIADIISVIDGIAFQTNILALNAAVEAARAGEQGRGFAVVASEVRSLAGRSAEAAKEIKSLIQASVERVEQGTTLVDKAGETMAEVVTSIRRVTDLMSGISAASHEQSLGVAQVGETVVQMDQMTQQNAALVEEMAAAASSLREQAQDLVKTVAVFQLAEQNTLMLRVG